MGDVFGFSGRLLWCRKDMIVDLTVTLVFVLDDLAWLGGRDAILPWQDNSLGIRITFMSSILVCCVGGGVWRRFELFHCYRRRYRRGGGCLAGYG